MSAEAHGRVINFNDLICLICRHLEMMRKLENCGEDLTSAEIILDSLRISLFVAARAWHQARFDDDRDGPLRDARRASATLESESHLAVVAGTEINSTKLVHQEIPTTRDEHEFVTFTKEPAIQEPSGVPSVASDSYQKEDPSIWGFNFRSLTQEEKNEFAAALEVKSKRLLAALADKVVYLGESAA